MSGSAVDSFPPVARRDARVLVLGTMPSVASLRARQYYAHPQNMFWDIMGELFGADRHLPYRVRLRKLQDAGVALWDVARVCERRLSADATMREVEPNDFARLVGRCPDLGAVFCNGRKAEELFRKLVVPRARGRLAELPVRYLPSTSPANASIPRPQRARAWRALLGFADRD